MTATTPSLREAAQMALDALIRCTKYEQADYDALEALSDALALPEAEPVAWMAHYTNKSGLQCVYTSSSYTLAVENDANGAPTPLYASTYRAMQAVADALKPDPVERKPLPDDEFLAICLGMELMKWNRARPESQRFVKVAYETAVAEEVLREYREIEAAHGIRGES